MSNVMYIFSSLADTAGRLGKAAAAVFLTCVLFGCATVPPPVDSMDMAQSQLESARQAGAADYAPVDLGFAAGKLQQAQAAMAKRDYADAADLAAESRADSELARVKAQLGAAREQIQNKVKENTRLRAQNMPVDATAPQDLTVRPSFDPVPADDMPAASSSTLSAPAAGGFQTVAPATPPVAAAAPATSAPTASKPASIDEVQP